MNRRLLSAALGLLISLAISAVAWVYFDTFLLFLFVPLVPFLLGRGGGDEATVRECPTCGFRTRDPAVAYCPRDGTELETED